MTVQFILPEATSFPKERKLHDRLFLVLLYNLLCKTFKDHSSAFAASSLSERNPLLQERCFPIASAKVGHFRIPCKRSPKKKCEKNSFAPILLLHSIAKSVVKPIFSPLPHPTFFTPKSPFFPLFPVLDSISGTFSRTRTRFFPFYRLFSLPFSHFESKSRQFFEGTSLFSAPKFTFFLLFPVFPHASGTSSRDLTLYFPHTPLCAQREDFSDSGFPFLHPLPHLHISIDFLSALHSPSLFTTPPLSFSFLPTFPSPSPINARSCAPSRTTRVCVHPHTPTRQEVFVYCLHRFTHLPQSAVHQHIRCEEKQEKAFTKYTTISKSRYYHKRSISSTVNSICRRSEPHPSPP